VCSAPASCSSDGLSLIPATSCDGVQTVCPTPVPVSCPTACDPVALMCT
jgi:hypothetical protein